MRASRRAPTHAVGAKLVRYRALICSRGDTATPSNPLSARDDLRTRNAAAGIRRGSGSESRERREDGADDHPLGNRKLGVCSGGNLPAEAQSPRGAAASTDLFGAEALWLRQESFGSGCFRLRYYILNSGIARIMNSSNSGTVNAMSPCAGL